MLKKGGYKLARKLPYIGEKIQSQIDSAIKDIEDNAFQTNGQNYVTKLPFKGMTKDEIMSSIKTYKEIGTDTWDKGYVSGTIYQADPDLSNLMVDVFREYTWANPLHFDIFPDVRKMEAEVVQMCVNMYNGDSNCCGVMTTGGTESILLAMKCYHQLGKERGIKVPEIVVPASIHPAFDKACYYFGMKITHVPVDKVTGKVVANTMKKYISRRTIAIVGSCPSFPHGCIDPLEDIAKLARRYNVYMHVDCCLGGFLVPFMKKAGYDVPLFDFRIPEVTSISIDTHKYGYSPKGSSVILYRNKNIRRHQYFSSSDWSGGVYASATLPGSRVGNVVATTWASMMYHGEKGYVESTKKVIECTRYLHDKISKIRGIKIIAQPEVSVIAFTSNIFDIFLMSEELSHRHWHLSPLQFPSGIHITVTMQHTRGGAADRLIKDLKEIAEKLCKEPWKKAEGAGAVYGLSQQIPDRGIVHEITAAILDTYYSCKAGSKTIQNGVH